LPLNRIGALNRIGRVFSMLEQEFEREPSAAEIAAELNMTPQEVHETLRIGGRHLSLDATVGDDESRLLDTLENTDTPPPDQDLMKESLKIEIQEALATLDAREAEVLRLYFGLGGEHPMTLEEIGERFRLTRERVRQIKEKALQRLRHTSRSRKLRAYLG
jgi:RNA polymerase primary sigma factor